MADTDKHLMLDTKKELPAWLQEKASSPDSSLWLSAYNKVEGENHYQAGEGPIPAMTRLKQDGLLNDLTIDDINQQGHAKAKTELGADGTLGRNYYTTADSVLNDKEEQREVGELVEKARAQEKLAQAERLAPSADQIRQAMTPEIEQALRNNGLETDPEKIRQAIVDAISSDTMPTGVMQKRGDGDFPIMAGYMATGAINGEQRQQILDQQKQDRAQWRAANPDAAKGAEFKMYQTGDLMRQKFGQAPIDAADALLTKLQPQHN